MSTAHFHWSLLIWRDYMQIPLLELLPPFMLLSDALQDHVWSLGFIEGDHLYSRSIL
jgi:hypothetical protein